MMEQHNTAPAVLPLDPRDTTEQTQLSGGGEHVVTRPPVFSGTSPGEGII